ncbi:hypothetical protein T07_6228 [Trichinella nelsoni]|uniref:Uncharacterized protein n=1 Tax=Trichinella nelsoni TaxID=6336 RepID=A0A0V0RRC2_9BILA|nr:hypothetical protein T07_6228 [Trichinella nelsoni]
MNFRYKCYYDDEYCLEDICPRAFVLFPFPLLLLKSHHSSTFFAISRQIRFYGTCE